MTENICRGNKNDPIALESCFGWVVSRYYESPFSIKTKSVTNLRLNTHFLKRKHFFKFTYQCESNKI